MDGHRPGCFDDADRGFFCAVFYEQTSVAGQKKLGPDVIVSAYLHRHSFYSLHSEYELLAAGAAAGVCLYRMCILLSAQKVGANGASLADGGLCDLYAVFQKIKEVD
jgi:hypothetical protein